MPLLKTKDIPASDLSNCEGSAKMSAFSWDQRARRAEQLAGEYPASAEILRDTKPSLWEPPL